MSLRGRLRGAVWFAAGRPGPLSAHWGRERGTPVDRWYIDRFLAGRAGDIRGRVLEVMDDRYTREFGSGVESSDVLDIDPANTAATLVADLAEPERFAREAYDCVVVTQTLQFVYALDAAVDSIHRSLRPGGICLATVPVVSRLDRPENNRGEFWRLTPGGCERLFGDRFGPEQVEIATYGNALSCVAFLLGLPAEELGQRELAAEHPLFPLVVGVRAEKD
jgi:SAM-dependent methyltransferase